MTQIASGADTVAVSTDRPAEGASGRWILATLALSMLLPSLGVSIASVALPTLADVFSASFPQVQWIVLAYLLTITVVSVGVGRWGDMMGHKRVMLAGIGIFTAASFLCGLAPSLWVLIGARAVQGFGAAILMALTIALVAETVPKEKTGSAMGLLGTMSAIGTALGPSLGGLLIAAAGWRSIFLFMTPIGILVFVLVIRHLPKSGTRAKTDGTSFDVLGSVLLALTLAAYAFAMTAGGGRPDGVNGMLLVAAAVGVVLFLISQTRMASPLIRLQAFRDRALSGGLVLNVIVAAVIASTLVVGPFYLSRSLGLTEAVVGLVLASGPVISAFSGVPAGRIVDRFGTEAVMALALILMAAGCVGLAAIPAGFGIAGYIAAIAVLTPGYQLFQAANNTAVMKDVGKERRGVVSGMLGLSRNLGLITGASAMGTVFAYAAGTGDIRAADALAVATGMHATFAVAAAVLGIALLAMAGLRLLKRVRRR